MIDTSLPSNVSRWQFKYETKGIYSALNVKLWLIKKWFIIRTTSVSALGLVGFCFFFNVHFNQHLEGIAG